MSLSPHGRRHCARCRRARCRWGFTVSGFHLQRGVPPTVGAVGGQLRCKWNPAAAAAVSGIPPTAAAVVGIPPTARTHLQSVTQLQRPLVGIPPTAAAVVEIPPATSPSSPPATHHRAHRLSARSPFSDSRARTERQRPPLIAITTPFALCTPRRLRLHRCLHCCSLWSRQSTHSRSPLSLSLQRFQSLHPGIFDLITQFLPLPDKLLHLTQVCRTFPALIPRSFACDTMTWTATLLDELTASPPPPLLALLALVPSAIFVERVDAPRST